MSDQDAPLALADAGPLDREVLGAAEADGDEVRTADQSLHL